ncbi:MAG: Actin-related protein 2/3 complex subunit 4 [Cercozoa sp. M6MM]
MSQTLAPYLNAIRRTLEAALCLRNFASQKVERHNKPEVEVAMDKEVLLEPVVIARSDVESCLIEPSVNSVRISIRIKQANEMETILADRFSRFLMQRAEDFVVLRRVAVPGYDISFLITNFQTEDLWKHKLVDFVIQFMEDINKEISDMVLSVNSRARTVSGSFLKQFI